MVLKISIKSVKIKLNRIMKGEPEAVQKNIFTKCLISSLKIKNQINNIAIIIFAAGTGYKLFQQP